MAMTKDERKKAAQALGAQGGKSTSPAKRAAARKNIALARLAKRAQEAK